MSEEFSGWAVVEVMGHRVVSGWCEPIRVAGVDMLKVTKPTPEAPEGIAPLEDSVLEDESTILSGAAIFALNPCSEKRARAAAYPDPPVYRPQLRAYGDEADDPDEAEWDEPPYLEHD